MTELETQNKNNDILEINDLSPKLLSIYYKSIDQFESLIPEDYIHKNKLTNRCTLMKRKMLYAAPEICRGTFYELLISLLESGYLPENANGWSKTGWEKLIDGHNQASDEYENHAIEN